MTKYIISVILMSILLCCLLVYAGSCGNRGLFEVRENPPVLGEGSMLVPPGWHIEKHKLTNEYRWCMPSGFCGNATFKTSQRAIEDSWKLHNFKKWQEEEERKEQQDKKNWQR